MDIDLNAPIKVKVIQEALLLRHTVEFEVDRPTQAWQWMNQTRCVPDQYDWVRAEVYESWRRCLDDYHLPLGNLSNWDNYRLAGTVINDPQTQDIARLIKQLSENFHIFLKEAGIIMVLTAADGRLLYVLGEKRFPGSLVGRMCQDNSIWCESVIGNNGIGTALELKKPVAFQGMEHYVSALHAFTTVGYPLMDETGQLNAVIGLISDHKESMNSLFAFLHLICVLVTTNLPLAQNPLAQKRVLEQIPFKQVGKSLATELATDAPEALNAVLKKAIKLQTHKIPILITGESGVGKDHFVNLIKNAGPRRDGPLIAINCASIPHELIESELFGYEAGSFTGARNNGKPGKFRLADKGTLFLDEIGDMSFDLQSTLLRVLETSEFTPVGGTKPVRVDVQVVAATNVHLLDAVEAGRFRRDLYYRLNGAQIHLPPLRERPDKKELILNLLNRELSKLPFEEPVTVSEEVIGLFQNHPWPGNIRQLLNVIRSTLYTAGSAYITLDDLPQDFIMESNLDNRPEPAISYQLPSESAMEVMSLADWEEYGIKAALLSCEGNISLAAKKLGITRSTLYKKMERFGLTRLGGREPVSGQCETEFFSTNGISFMPATFRS